MNLNFIRKCKDCKYYIPMREKMDRCIFYDCSEKGSEKVNEYDKCHFDLDVSKDVHRNHNAPWLIDHLQNSLTRELKKTQKCL